MYEYYKHDFPFFIKNKRRLSVIFIKNYKENLIDISIRGVAKNGVH